jgi:hypothetical protein
MCKVLTICMKWEVASAKTESLRYEVYMCVCMCIDEQAGLSDV